jgi:hypothetical protein
LSSISQEPLARSQHACQPFYNDHQATLNISASSGYAVFFDSNVPEEISEAELRQAVKDSVLRQAVVRSNMRLLESGWIEGHVASTSMAMMVLFVISPLLVSSLFDQVWWAGIGSFMTTFLWWGTYYGAQEFEDPVAVMKTLCP